MSDLNFYFIGFSNYGENVYTIYERGFIMTGFKPETSQIYTSTTVIVPSLAAAHDSSEIYCCF